MTWHDIFAFSSVIISIIILISTISYNFHKKVYSANSALSDKIANATASLALKEREDIETVFNRFDGYKKHIENDLLNKKVDEKYCNLQHKQVCETLERIEKKVDSLIEKS